MKKGLSSRSTTIPCGLLVTMLITGCSRHEVAHPPEQAVAAGAQVSEEERDRNVIEAFLFHLRESEPIYFHEGPEMIALGNRTNGPYFRGYEMLIEAYLNEHEIPAHLLAGLRTRNSVDDNGIGVEHSLTAMKFAPEIVRLEPDEFWSEFDVLSAELVEKYPDGPYGKSRKPVLARFWVDCFLPSYSEDGTTALVAAFVGPCRHPTTVTAILHLKRGKWVVEWHEVCMAM